MPNEIGVFFSFLFFIIGVSHLACPKEWEAFFRDLRSKSYAGLVIAMYTLPPGMVILSFHNNWVVDFPVFITICGWIMVIKSVIYLLFPDFPATRLLKQKHLARKIQAIGLVMTLFGGLSGLSYYW